MYQTEGRRACEEAVVVVNEADPVAYSGGALSFDAFYRAEYAAVARLAFALTGRRDVAEELAQDGFLACHQQWATVSSFDNPAAWVRRVVTNRCVSSGRRHLTELRLLTRLGGERHPEPQLAADTADLWSVVRELPKRQAQSLALAFLEDRTVSDVAEILGIGEESVRTHIRRGRAAVAARLRESNDDE